MEDGGCKIDDVDEFECLGSQLISDNECMNEVRRTMILNGLTKVINMVLCGDLKWSYTRSCRWSYMEASNGPTMSFQWSCTETLDTSAWRSLKIVLKAVFD